MNNKIKYMNMCITNRCNLACVMCDIWKEKDKIDLSVKIVNDILEAECLHEDLDITLTGGELFMHQGLWPIADSILSKDRRWLKGISTNGTMPKEVSRFLNEFSKKLTPDFTFHISLDGINYHDVQRGKESLNKILNTVQMIKDFSPLFGIKIKFTITPVNYTDIIPTFRFCRENDLDFRVKLVEYAENYTNRVDHQDFIFDESVRASIIQDLTQIAREKLKSRDNNAMFIADTIHFLQGKVHRVAQKISMDRVFIMSEGDVFTCIHSPKLGNLRQNDLDDMWATLIADKDSAASAVQDCRCHISYHGA